MQTPATAGKSNLQYVFALFFLAAGLTGPVGNFPIGDDWQYGYPVMTWTEQGDMDFKGIFAPNLLLQVGVGYLFCKIAGSFDFTWLRISTLFFALLAVWFFFKTARRLGAAPSGAVLAAGALAFSPLFYYLSFTFFTDVPFLALFLVSVWFFVKYIASGRSVFVVWAVLWAAASYCIRQPGLLLIPVFGLYLLQERRFSQKGLLAAALCFLTAAALYAVMEQWAKPALSIADNFVPVGDQFYTALVQAPLSTLVEWGKKGIKTFTYLGVFGLPFVPFLHKKTGIGTRALAFMFLGNMALFVVLYFSGKTFPFGGNILFNLGLGSELLADVYTLGLPNTPKAPEWTMLAVQLAGQWSATYLLWYIHRHFKQLSAFQKKAFWLLAATNLVYLPVMSITSFFDRYLLPTIASFFLVLSFFVETKTTGRALWRFAPMLLVGGFSLLATRDFMAWNRAKSEAFLFLQNRGVPITEMDAGYEYNGFYNYHFPKEEKEGRSFWWVTDDRYLIAFGPVQGYAPMARFPYRRWLFLREDGILVLQRND